MMENGRFASNAGGGIRVLNGRETWAFGGNVYYDYRNTHRLKAHQVGAGLEALNQYVDVRLNGYIPVGGYKHSDALRFNRFVGNHIETRRKIEAAYANIQGEVGVLIPGTYSRMFQLYAAAGPYYLFERKVSGVKCQDAVGGQVRFSAKFFQMIELNVSTTFDRVNHWRAQGGISLNFPVGDRVRFRSHEKESRQQAFLMRTKERPYRSEIIPICKTSKKALLLHADGALFNAIFVNNLTACPGLGTIENPFCSTSLAEANSTFLNHMIYIFAGDGTPRNYDTGFVLDQGQWIQGSGQPFDLLGVHFPAQTPDVQAILDQSFTPVIVATGNNTVSGLTLRVRNAGAANLGGTGVRNLHIINNHFDQIVSSGPAMTISDVQGVVVIENNLVTNSGAQGVSATTLANPVNFTVKNNSFVNVQDRSISVSGDNGDVRVNILHNNIYKDSPAPIGAFDIGGFIRPADYQIRQNTIESNSTHSIFAIDGRLWILNNTIINTTGGLADNGILYQISVADQRNFAIIHDNTITIPIPRLVGTTNPILVQHGVPSLIKVDVQRNSIIGPSPLGPLNLNNTSTGTACTILLDNISQPGYIINAGGAGVYIVQSTDGMNSGVQLGNIPINTLTTSGTVEYVFPDQYSGP